MKKLFLIGLVVLGMLGFTACGGGETPVTEEEVTEEPAEASEEEVTEEPAEASEEEAMEEETDSTASEAEEMPAEEGADSTATE